MAKLKRFHRPDRDRAIHQVLQAVREMTPGQISRNCFVSESTIRNWRRVNGVRYPQHVTLSAVARLAGLRYDLIPIGEPARPQRPIGRTAANREDERRAGL